MFVKPKKLFHKVFCDLRKFNIFHNMANSNANKRAVPGFNFSETEISTPKPSIDSTALGLVGETLKGPAMTPVDITSWSEFKSRFGGTDPSVFAGSGFPKYEAPYIAQAYLKKSKYLTFTRILGLSGENRGCAWQIVGTKNGTDKVVIATIRANGTYGYNASLGSKKDTTTGCDCSTGYDELTYAVGEKATVGDCSDAKKFNAKAMRLVPYTSLKETGSSCTSYTNTSVSADTISVSASNFGRFKIQGIAGRSDKDVSVATADDNVFEYVVSLNPADNDYILKVLPSQPCGEEKIWIENLYDVAWQQLVTEKGYDGIQTELAFYEACLVSDYSGLESVSGILSVTEDELTRSDIGKRFLYVDGLSIDGVSAHTFSYSGKTQEYEEGHIGEWDKATVAACVDGQIYTVAQTTDKNGKRHYVYRVYDEKETSGLTGTAKLEAQDKLVYGATGDCHGSIVYCNEDGLYYKKTSATTTKQVTCDVNNYKSSYRYSSTPWFVSEVKGDASKMGLVRLFRFHTIGDGDYTVSEIKVSIENVSVDEGTFDVVVRDFSDTDAYPVVLERYSNLTMKEGDNNYIALRIGSFDGQYNSNSNYITVEVNTSRAAQNSVPAGFMGYPIPQLNGEAISGTNPNDVKLPDLTYNQVYYTEIRSRKQYFGLSNLSGVDADMFMFHGMMGSIDTNPEFVTPGFHLDSRLDLSGYDAQSTPKITVDGEEGFTFKTTGISQRTNKLSDAPVIASDEDMENTIYSDIRLRKFTACFYGGYDGWDNYRTERTNGNEFSAAKYKGYIGKYGSGRAIDTLSYQYDNTVLNLDENALTSDYYAYLAAIRSFANTASTDINILVAANVGLTYQSDLAKELVEVGEETRGDSIVPLILEDHPKGLSNMEQDMFDAEEAVANAEDSEVDSTYAVTFWPSVKHYDTDNKAYVYLSPIKDYVMNAAESDKNNTTHNRAIAGMFRGKLDDTDVAKKKLIVDEEETLYPNCVNPVKSFAKDGAYIWGAKCLSTLDDDSPLSRIEIRRMVLRLRRQIKNATIGYLFDPNDTTTSKAIESAIKAICKNFAEQRALLDYKVIVDTSDEARDRREVNVKIGLYVSKNLEWINVNMVFARDKNAMELIG